MGQQVQVGLPRSPRSLITASTTVHGPRVAGEPGWTFGQFLFFPFHPALAFMCEDESVFLGQTPRMVGHRKCMF